MCSYTYPALKKCVPVALSATNIPVELHRKYARKSRDYLRGYGAGLSAEELEGAPIAKNAMECEKAILEEKKYRSHRSPPGSEILAHKKYKPWEKKNELLLRAKKIEEEERARVEGRSEVEVEEAVLSSFGEFE